MAEQQTAGQQAAGQQAAGRQTAGEQAAGEQAAGQEAGAAVVTARADVAGAERMRALGSRLAALLGPGDLVILDGPLGAGKTTLVQGIGAGLGVRGPITSPTFVIARVHPSLRGGPDLVHADAYRLGSRIEVDDLDLDADLDHAVTVVEWGEGLVENLAAAYLLVAISLPAARAAPPAGTWSEGGAGGGDQPRTVTVTGYGGRWTEAARPLAAALSEAA
jgi:tRNA threonylcarbamoyladenosine biosynthesis protein TsaE